MKAKTKNQLRDEIYALEIERDALKKDYEWATGCTIEILEAFAFAIGASQKNLPSNIDTVRTLAFIATTFFAKVNIITDIDFTTETENAVRFFDNLCVIMGFDEVTTTVIKQKVPNYHAVLKMTLEGKSDEEIQEFIKKVREAEGR